MSIRMTKTKDDTLITTEDDFEIIIKKSGVVFARKKWDNESEARDGHNRVVEYFCSGGKIGLVGMALWGEGEVE